MNDKRSNYIFFQSFLVIILLAITIEVNCDGGYGGSYPEPPAQKMKFNIGFNLPSMSISLPKLELPQISIKASVKQKKPFTLQLPVIKFNAHAATEEDDAEYPTAPQGYASAEPDTSPYAGVQSGGYLGPAANMGYERPAAGQYGAPEPDAGYASSSHQAPAAATPYNGQPQGQAVNQYQSQPQQPVHSTQSYGQQSPHQQQPQPAYVTNAVQTYSVQPSQYQQEAPQPAQYQQEAPQPSQYGFQGRAIADYRASTSANGYYVPKPTTSNNQQQQARPAMQYQQQPQMQLHQLQNQQLQVQQVPVQQVPVQQPVRRPVDENVRYYEAAQVYPRPNMQMNQQPSQAGNYEIITAPEFAKLYGSRLHSNFARRTTFQTVPDYETVWYAAPSNQNPSVVPAPSSMAGSSMAGWTPILL